MVAGTLAGSLDPSLPDADVAVVWQNSAGSPDVIVGETVPVTLSGPAQFSLGLYAPPIAAALNDYTQGGTRKDEAKVGVGFVALVKRGEQRFDEQDILGIAEDHLVVYVDRDVKPGTFAEQLLNGQLKKGFHIMSVKRLSEAEKNKRQACADAATTDAQRSACGNFIFDEMAPAPGGMKTKVPITVGPAKDLDVPNWT